MQGPRTARTGVRRLATLAMLACVTVAGCSDPGEVDGEDGPGQSASVSRGDGEAAVPQDLPAWSIGRFWTYTVDGDETTYVVAGETADDWIVRTDSAERAFADLRDDISRLGPQRKSDLAGSQGGDRVEFFRWPLRAGMPDWTTRWDGQEVRIHVLGVNPGFAELEARLANATPADPPLYRYTYDDAAGWFSQLTRYAPDGSQAIRFDLVASGDDWAGELATWTVTEAVRAAGALGGPLTLSGSYEVPVGATDVWVHAAVHCSAGGFEAGTSPFPFAAGPVGLDERGAGVSAAPCPANAAFTGAAGAPQAPAQGGAAEPWGYSVTSPPGSAGSYEFEVLVRTLGWTPFP